jgi:hypothetical protein
MDNNEEWRRLVAICRDREARKSLVARIRRRANNGRSTIYDRCSVYVEMMWSRAFLKLRGGIESDRRRYLSLLSCYRRLLLVRLSKRETEVVKKAERYFRQSVIKGLIVPC